MVTAVDAQIEQPIQQLAELGHALGGLPRRQEDGPVSDARGFQAPLQGLEMRRAGNIAVGDDDRIRPAQDARNLEAGPPQQPAADHDVVAARAKLDRDPLGLGHRTAPLACAASAFTTRSTTVLIGTSLLSTTRSASA